MDEPTITNDRPLRIRDKRGGDRYFIDNLFLRGGYGAKVKAHGIAVYNALCLSANLENQECFPSYQTIADMTGMSRRQAIDSMAELVDLGVVEVEGKAYSSNTYILIHKDNWKATSAQDALSSALPALPSAQGALPLVQDVHRNKTNSNKTNEQDEGTNSLFLFWKSVCAELALIDRVYKRLVSWAEPVSRANGTFTIRATTKANRDLLDSRLRPPMERIARRLSGQPELELRVICEEATHDGTTV